MRPESTELAAGSGCGCRCNCLGVCCRETGLLGGSGCWTAARRKCRGLRRLLVGCGDTCPELCIPPIIPSPSTEGEPRADGQLGMRKPRPILWFPAAQSHPQSFTHSHSHRHSHRNMPPHSLSDTPSLMETHLGPALCALCALGIAGASSCLPWNLLRGRGAGWASATGYILALPGLLPGRPLALPRQPTCSQQELINLFFHHFPVSLVAQGLGWALLRGK